MALTGIVNLAERLLNQSQSQPQTEQNAPQTTPNISPFIAPIVSPENSVLANTLAAPITDAFTSFAQTPAADSTAQAAGLFRVANSPPFTAAANTLLGDGSAAATANSVAAVPATEQTTAPATQPAAATVGATNGTAAVLQAVSSSPAQTAAAVGATLPAVPPPLPSVAQAATTNSERQALNNLLAAEGLSTANITQVDNVAQSLNDYDPTDYAALVNQLRIDRPPSIT
jgi:hypothetical protein